MKSGTANILLVEDESFIAMALAKVLSGFGYKVVTADSGERVLHLLEHEFAHKENPFNLILMDIDLGNNIHGTDVAKIVLQSFNIPIIFLTSHQEEDYMHAVEDIPHYGFVTKESGYFVLKANIDMALKLHKKHSPVEINQNTLPPLADITPYFIYSLNGEGRFTSVNESLCRAWNMSENEIIDKTLKELGIPTEAATPWCELIQKVIQTKRTCISNIAMPLPNHRTRFDEVVLTPIIYKAGEVIGIQGYSRELSHPIKMDSHSQEDLERIQALSDNLTKGLVYQIDSGKSGEYRKFTYISKTVEQLHEVSTADALENAWVVYNQVDEPFKRLVLEKEATALKTLTPFSAEVKFILPSGKVRWGLMNSTPRRLPNQHLVWDGIEVDITEIKRKEEQIQQLLADKEMILREVHHRVRNNMITLYSLLDLHSSSVHNQEILYVLKDVQSRISSMMMLYTKLHQSDTFTEVSIKEYIISLIDIVMRIFPNFGQIKIVKELEDFAIHSRLSFPLGLIINEILTNAMKHAFIDRKEGVLLVKLTKENSQVTLAIQDNGVGITKDTNERKGFGLKLIEILVPQIKGQFTIESCNGTLFRLDFIV